LTPLDSAGQYRHNTEAAQMHSKAQGKQDPGKSVEGKSSGDGSEHTITDHGDGTFTTHHPEHGEQHHESIGHLHAHISKVHGEEGHKHVHIHHDGETVHEHRVEGGGEPEHEEHDPENLESLKQNLGQFLGEEEQEGKHEGNEGAAEHEGAGLGGLY